MVPTVLVSANPPVSHYHLFMSLALSKQGLSLSPLLSVNFQPPQSHFSCLCYKLICFLSFPRAIPIHSHHSFGSSFAYGSSGWERGPAALLRMCLDPVFSNRWEIPQGQGPSLLPSSLLMMHGRDIENVAYRGNIIFVGQNHSYVLFTVARSLSWVSLCYLLRTV